MSKAAQELKDKLQRLTKPPDVTLDGDVTAVNENDYTCTVTLPNGLALEEVQLKALKGKTDCVVVIPKIGTTVQIVNVSDPDWMVISCDEVDKVLVTAAVKVELICDDIEINGGANKGLVMLDELKNNLESLKNYCEAMNAALPAAFGAINAGASASGTLGMNEYIQGMAGQSISFSNMENTKVKH